jgi:hypothetical protein
VWLFSAFHSLQLYAAHLVGKDTKISACFEDKYGLNFMNSLRCVTRLGLPYIHNKKRGYFALSDQKRRHTSEKRRLRKRKYK